MQTRITKIISSILALMLLLTVASPVISYAKDEFKTASELENQGVTTNNDNVEIDVYYKGGTHTKVIDIQEEEEKKVYVKVKVKEVGYLENTTIDFSACNFEIADDESNAGKIQTINQDKKAVVLNKIVAPGETEIVLNISPKNNDNKIKINEFNQDNTVKVTGSYTNSNIKQKIISKTIVIHTQWHAEPELELGYGITKYIPYSIDQQKGLLLQTKVKTNIKQNILPIKTTEIKITVPSIGEEKPEKVKVYANSTSATNGENTGKEFTEANYSYDKENSLLTITMTNTENESGEVDWNKENSDEYVINYIYSANVYEHTRANTEQVRSTANYKCVAYADTEVTKEITASIDQTMSGKLGEFIDFEKTIKESTIGKGYMYLNKTTEEENKRESSINEEYSIEVGYADLMDKLTITANSDTFIDEKASTIATTANNLYVKNVKISQADFQRIFGTDGVIKIIANEAVIETADKTLTPDEDGNIVLDLSTKGANSITIETTKPVAEGKLKINIEKAINKETEYSTDVIKTLKALRTFTTTKAFLGTNEVGKVEKENFVELVEPTSNAEISIDSNISTVITNENVGITAILKTMSEKDLLYKNPEIRISLPSYITDIRIKSVKPLYNEELQMGEAQVENVGGSKVIRIPFQGEQTKYNDQASKGTSVVIYADIDADKTIASKQDVLAMEYTNENDAGTTNRVSTTLNVVAPKGIVAINEISAYSEDGAKISLVNEETTVGKLDAFKNARTANANGRIINNYENGVSEVKILGRIPNTKSANYTDSSLMGNTINTTLNGAITLNGASSYTIYYSESDSADSDLNKVSNGWSTAVANYSAAKSYLIVLDNEMVSHKDVSWSYSLNIPAEVNYKDQIKSNYMVYLNNNSETGTVAETKASPEITLKAEDGPSIEARLYTYDFENNGTVTYGKRVTMYTEIKNTGSQVLENVSVEIPLPEHMTYRDTISSVTCENGVVKASVNNINPGETKKVPIFLILSEIGETSIISRIKADQYEGYIKTNEYNITIIDAPIALSNYIQYNYLKMGVGDMVEMELAINKLQSQSLKNLKIEYRLPEGTKYVSSVNTVYTNCTITANEAGNIVTIVVPELTDNENITIRAEIKQISNDMRTQATTNIDGKEYVSNIVMIETKNISYDITANNLTDIYVETDDLITTQFELVNTGEDKINDITTIYNIPEGTEFVSGNIVVNGTESYITQKNETEKRVEYIVSELPEQDKAILTITLRVTQEQTDKEQQIASYLETEHYGLGTKQSPTITFIIKAIKDDEDDNNNTIEGNNEISNNEENGIVSNNEIVDPGEDDKGNKIRGKIWIDANKNGKYDSNEETVSGITVLLINKKTGKLELTTITNSIGRYTFDKVQKGEYLVAFLYNTQVYTATEYQKNGVDEQVNSDAINSTIVYQGIDTKVALTDTIEMLNSSIENIDLGIYRVAEFDLSLQKYINKITVNNDTGVSINEYQNKDKTLVKTEIASRQMASSTVIIEYKIVVKNEGNVPGYAKKIVDYIPDDLKFSAELNPNAYIGKDGNIYSEELSKTVINPGESKEITLVLSKKMTGENTGTVVNTAEIAEDYNILGLQDKNSTPGNKSEKENDLGSANVVITVRTGQIVIYTTLIISVLGILFVGIYSIKKYVIKN